MLLEVLRRVPTCPKGLRALAKELDCEWLKKMGQHVSTSVDEFQVERQVEALKQIELGKGVKGYKWVGVAIWAHMMLYQRVTRMLEGTQLTILPVKSNRVDFHRRKGFFITFKWEDAASQAEWEGTIQGSTDDDDKDFDSMSFDLSSIPQLEALSKAIKVYQECQKMGQEFLALVNQAYQPSE